MKIGAYAFDHLCRIEPENGESGAPRRFELRDAKGITIWGGPFCRFSVRPEVAIPAAYALVVAGEVVYVGQTTNLAARFGPRGYGEARPPGGPDDHGDTNRRINNLVLEACSAGRRVDLYYLVAYDRLEVENDLLTRLQPPWNLAGPSRQAAKEWGDALKASALAARLLVQDRNAGEARFAVILRAHPSDGMVYMNRAKAYEEVGDLHRAALDFARAEVLVPYPGRKAEAREGLRRVGFAG